MLKDIQFALRQFAKTPGFTATVIFSLALGIAANATVLAWLHRFVLRPLPGVARQEQLAVVVSNVGSGCVSLPDLRDLTNHPAVFAGGFASMPTPACLTIDRQAEWIQAQIVTANFFSVLEITPILGRTFTAEEDQKPGGNPVLVISENLWRRQFGAAPDVVGRVVDLNRTAFTIIGVVPAAFEGSLPPARFDAWAPASMIWQVRNQEPYFLTSRTARGWHNLVRLAPGVTLAAAQSAVAAGEVRLAAELPNTNRDIHHHLVPLSECPWGGQTVIGPALRLLVAVSLGVQLIVTANVANLLLARAVDRRREVAIRLAAGASRGRIILQFLTESLLLALGGGFLGILAATWTIDTIAFALPAELAADARFSITLDPATLALATGLTLVTGVAFGLVPALQAQPADVAHTLKQGGRGTGAAGTHRRLQRALVVAEVALAVVLLVGAGLCAKGLREAERVDVGCRTDHVLLASLQIGMNGYTAATAPKFYRELQQRLAREPGIEDAALASWFPLGLAGCKGTAVNVEGYNRAPGENPTYEYAIISPRYFATLRIPLVAGRDFTDEDVATTPAVAIVNEHFAARFWPGQDPIGRRFRAAGVWRTVVGVAKAGKYNRVDEPPWSFFYLPYQQGVPDLDLGICVRTSHEPAAFAASIRNVVHQLDPGVEVLRTLSFKSHAALALFVPRLASSLLLLLGAVALALAAMGVFGVIAYTVSQRTQEFGVRLALGAEPRNLLIEVMRQGLQLGLAGVLIGAVIALAASRLMRGFLYGVSPFDLATFAWVAGVLIVVAVVACLVPARRAMRVDPVTALRAE